MTYDAVQKAGSRKCSKNAGIKMSRLPMKEERSTSFHLDVAYSIQSHIATHPPV